MKIITPPHSTPAQSVVDFSHIEKEAHEMIDYVNEHQTRTNKEGDMIRSLALHNAQVSTNPYNYFVTTTRIAKMYFENRRIIINARIVKGFDEIDFQEACLSFPEAGDVATRRFKRIQVEYQVPKSDGSLRLYKREMEGLGAIIIQHENDHARGSNIFVGKKIEKK